MAPELDDHQHLDAKQRLLDAAEEIFAEKGFDASSIREICKNAGVNIAGVNYYFGDKDNLYIEAVKRAHSCGMGDAIAERSVSQPQTAKQALEVFIREMAEQMHGPIRPSAATLVMRELAHPGKAAHVIVDEFIRPFAQQLWRIVHQMLPGMKEQQCLMVGLSIIGQLLYYRQNRPVSDLLFGAGTMDGLTTKQVADHVVRFTFAALGLAEPYPAQDSIIAPETSA